MLRSILRIPLLYPLVAFLLARRAVVQGWSMHPTLAPGERLLFDTLAYRLDRPNRGDVVLARHPTRPSTKIVKRIAAVRGDRVTVEGDDYRVEESPGTDILSSSAATGAEAKVLTLDEDEYFLVGDAPDLSTDARHFGPTKGKDVQGRAWMVYWPPRRMRTIHALRGR